MEERCQTDSKISKDEWDGEEEGGRVFLSENGGEQSNIIRKKGYNKVRWKRSYEREFRREGERDIEGIFQLHKSQNRRTNIVLEPQQIHCRIN